MGDLNGDGNEDLATANFTSATISVLLGNGNGSFDARTDYATGAGPNSIVMSDLNDDAELDLATANARAGTVSVLLGNGDGSFSAKADYAAGQGPQSLVTGDLNGDSVADLAVMNGSTGTTSILPGNGDGTLAPLYAYVVSIEGTYSAPALTCSDVNDDGYLDLVAADYRVRVLLGAEGGEFTLGDPQPATAGDASDIVVADFDGDGNLDLGVADPGGRGWTGAVYISPGAGDGTFPVPMTYSPLAGDNMNALAAGDLNHDAKADLAACAYQRLTVLLAGGDQVLAQSCSYEMGCSALAFGDVNNDGNLDLAVASREDNRASILLGRGDGTLGLGGADGSGR